MEKAKLLVEELAKFIGTELEFSEDGICELTVDDRLILLRYRPDDDDWLYFGFVTDMEEKLSPGQLEKALSLNLFGAETLGFHLGLFGNSLVLSGTAPMEALTAEVLAEKLLFFSRHAVAISGKINEVPAADAQETVVDSPFDANFISV